MTWAEQLVRIRRFLRDPDSGIWSDAFLLRLYNDEQFELFNKLGMNETVKAVRIPPMFYSTYLQDWEWTYTDHADGEVWKSFQFHDAEETVFTSTWESQALSEVDASETESGHHFTHPWEAFADGVTPGDIPPLHAADGFHRMLFIAFDRQPIEALTLKSIASDDPSWRTRTGTLQGYYRDETISDYLMPYPIPSGIEWDNEVLGLDAVTGGDFTDESNWTVGAGWDFDDDGASHSGGSATDLQQDIGAEEDEVWRIDFDVVSYTGEDILLNLGDGTTVTTGITAAGSYTFYLICGATNSILTVEGAASAVFTINNLVARKTYSTTDQADPDSSVYGTTVLDPDNNLLMVFEKTPTELAETTDESDFAVFVQKYVEYGVIERAYGANTDGRITSLSEYWAYRKKIGHKALQIFKNKRTQDRDYCLVTKGVPAKSTRRHPRLPDAYPAVW